MLAKITFRLVLGILLCSLATIEAVEFVRLVDDTSNDFSISNSVEESSSAILIAARNRERQVPPPPLLRRQNPKSQLLSARTFVISHPVDVSPQFLCIWRT